jgi:hypothetical protein
MNSFNFIKYLLLLIVFILFFSIVGVNKKTIDSIDNLTELQKNINDLRGLIWANYIFVSISLLIDILIISKRYYKVNKTTIIFTLIFIVLTTSLVIFEELSIKDYKVDIVKLNNIYIITTITNTIYFLLFILLNRTINEKLKPRQFINWDPNE